jgi:hypothetical protein
MSTREYWQLGTLSDDELEQRLAELCRRCAWTDAQVVAHLAELAARGLHRRKGRSLFAYCQKQLGLSENQAHYRIQAARIARQYPVVFRMLQERKIHLTALAQIRHYITPENHLALLDEVAGKTKEQILRLLAGRAPRPDAVNRIRRLQVGEMQLPAGPTGTLEPLSAEAYRLELHCTATLREKLELAADLMSHSNRSGDLAVVVERALDLLIDKLKKQRFGKTSRSAKSAQATAPKPVDQASCSREGERQAVPNSVKREVVARDGLACTYVCSDGDRCGARAFLQFDHRRAWAKGGQPIAENLRFMCATHNALLAEDEFGAAKVKAAIVMRRVRSGRGPPQGEGTGG